MLIFFLLASMVSCKKEEIVVPTAEPEAIKYDIIVVAGQSNTCYGYGYDSTTRIPSGVVELGRYDKDMQIIPATPSIHNHSYMYTKSSFGYDFARYYESGNTQSKRKVIVIGCGAIGTTFFENRWNKGDDLYNDMIKRTNHIMTEYPGSRVVAILWQQGESDMWNLNYQKNLDSMIVNVRKDLLPNKIPFTEVDDLEPVPFMLGGMVPYWTNLKSYRISHQQIIAHTENRLPRCFYVDPAGIEKPDNNVDTIHYSHENQMALAVKYWKRFQEIQ